MPTNPTTTDPRTSYTNTDIDVRNIAPLIDIVSPEEIPLLKLLGMDSGRRLLRRDITNRKVEWIEDELTPTSATLNEALDASETGVDVNTGHGTRFVKGSVIRIEDELMWVSSISTDTLTVTRGYAGSTAAAHVTGLTIEIVGHAQVEGDPPPTPRTVLTSEPFNYTQIFEDGIHITGSQLATEMYGITDEYDYQVEKKFKEQLILLERALIDGRRAVGSATTARSMGGLREFVTNGPADLSGAALTRRDLEDALQDVYELVGGAHVADLILCNAWAKRKITGFYEPSVRTERSERTGGSVISVVETEFGNLDVMLNRWVPENRVYLVRKEYIGVGAMKGREFYEERLAKTADAIDGHIIGEYTAVVKNANAHAVIKGFSTTS